MPEGYLWRTLQTTAIMWGMGQSPKMYVLFSKNIQPLNPDFLTRGVVLKRPVTTTARPLIRQRRWHIMTEAQQGPRRQRRHTSLKVRPRIQTFHSNLNTDYPKQDMRRSGLRPSSSCRLSFQCGEEGSAAISRYFQPARGVVPLIKEG